MVSLTQISNTIGENADLATCCTSSHVNKWSFKKPVNSNSMTALSTQDYYDMNDGFNLSYYNTPQQLLYSIQHPAVSYLWDYEARTAPFRLTDFEDYDHYKAQLCRLTFIGDNSGTVNTTLRLECTDLLDMIQHWQYFSGVRNYVDFIFLIYNYGTEYDQLGTQDVYVYKIDSIVDYDGNGEYDIRIPSMLATGMYEIRLCCSTATTGMVDGECIYYNSSSSQLSGNWYALPQECKQTFTVMSSGGGGGSTTNDYFNYLGIDFYDARYNYSNLTISNLSFINYIVINGATDDTFNIYVEYWYDNVSTPIKLGTASRTLAIQDMPWASIRINYNDNINVISDDDLNNRIAIRAEIAVTVNNTTQTRTLNKTINKE